MSRIGNKPVPMLDGVRVSLDGRTVNVQGPKGELSFTHRPEVTVELDASGKELLVRRGADDRISRSLHGLTRALIANMIEGCLNGFSKSLEGYGVGYGCQVQGDKLSVTCGMSHPAVFEIPSGLTVEVQAPQARGEAQPARFSVSGADKQAVGEFAADVRSARPPEPYIGKGIRYAGEHVRRKVGKALAGAGGA